MVDICYKVTNVLVELGAFASVSRGQRQHLLGEPQGSYGHMREDGARDQQLLGWVGALRTYIKDKPLCIFLPLLLRPSDDLDISGR